MSLLSRFAIENVWSDLGKLYTEVVFMGTSVTAELKGLFKINCEVSPQQGGCWGKGTSGKRSWWRLGSARVRGLM